MRKGFELLETRLMNEIIDLNRFENDIKLPKLYRLFLQTFKLPMKKSNNFIAYFLDEEVGFDDFSSDLEQIIKIYKSEESYHNFSMLPIISSGIHSGGICVCLEGENQDKIYLDNETYDGRFQLLANNIFEFVRGIIELEDGDDLSIYDTL